MDSPSRCPPSVLLHWNPGGGFGKKGAKIQVYSTKKDGKDYTRTGTEIQLTDINSVFSKGYTSQTDNRLRIFFR
jgi:hypothetical protein